MGEIQFLEKMYNIFLKDPINFILFGSLWINLYLFKEYVSLLKDNVDISKKLTVIMSNFEIDTNNKEDIKVISGSKNKTLGPTEDQKNGGEDNDGSDIKRLK